MAGAAGRGRLLDVDDPGQDAASRRYRLPDAHADVLLDADHPAHAGATAWWIGSLAEVLQRIPDVYRSGAGLPYPEYGADQAGFARLRVLPVDHVFWRFYELSG